MGAAAATSERGIARVVSASKRWILSSGMWSVTTSPGRTRCSARHEGNEVDAGHDGVEELLVAQVLDDVGRGLDARRREAARHQVEVLRPDAER